MYQKIYFPWWFVVILLAAFAVGYWAWSESLRQDQDQLFSNSPSAPSLTKEGVGGVPEGWQTYRNEEFGFEFKYPALGQNQRIRRTEEVSYGDFFESFYLEYAKSDNQFITVFTFSLWYAETTNLADWFLGLDEYCNQHLIAGDYFRFITQDNTSALIRGENNLLGAGYDLDHCGPRSDVFYIISPDGLGVVRFDYQGHDIFLDSYGYDSNEKLNELFSKILSSFKFDNDLSAYNYYWPGYGNVEYSFEVQYPSNWHFETATSNNKDGFFIKDPVSGASISIFPNGEFDHGIPMELEEKSELIVGGVLAKKDSWPNLGYEVLYLQTNRANWSSENRIEIFYKDQKKITDHILSTFRFIE